MLTCVALLAGLGTAAQAIPGLPLGIVFAITVALAVVAPLGSGARYGLLAEILPADGYLLGRAVFNMSNGIIQVLGYALGGVLVAGLSPRGTLLCGAALYLAGALVTRLGMRWRPARMTGRPSVAQTWQANRLLWSSGPRRYVFLALWVPNGLIVGCEALFVAYSPRHAGLLYAFTALGMLAGDTLAGRFTSPSWRSRLGPWLRLLLAAPYLAFAASPPLPLAILAATLASVGYSASLLLMERLMRLTPDELSGQAMGLQSSGMQAMQGVGAALAGAVAQWTASPAVAIVVMAAASIAVTLLLAPGLRATALGPQAPDPEAHGPEAHGPEAHGPEAHGPEAAAGNG